MSDVKFTLEQVMALCGYVVPEHIYRDVEYFKLEEGILQPYNGYGILPYKGVVVKAAFEQEI